MKKIILSTVLFLMAAFTAGADDIITKIDGEKIRAMVMEVRDNTVKYKRMDNPNGPVYVLDQSEIRSIEYENGLVEEFDEPSPEPEKYYANRYDVRYRDIAGMYRPQDYVEKFDDPYSAAVSGIASFFIPGLGQCLDGEWGRGLGIFAGNVGFSVLEAAETSIFFYSAVQGASYYRDYGTSNGVSNAVMTASLCAAILTASAQLAFNIWNICDAVNIAKVKNMYYQDLGRNTVSLDMSLEPHLAFTPSYGIGLQPVAGLSLNLRF